MPTDPKSADPTELPLQPTGSGVADEEMAHLRAELAEGEADDGPTKTQA